MRERRRLLLPGLTLVMVAALGWWLTSPERREPAPERTDREAERPTYTLTDAEFRSFDADGRRVSRLDSPEVEFREDADRWYLQQPVWQRRTPDGNTRWEGRSREGTLRGDRSAGELIGAVRLERIADDGATILRTDRLHIRPDDSYAETADPVTITGPNWRLDGIGARAWLDAERMEVLDDVRTRYDVP